MKKTVQISLNQSQYNLEEDAYHKLSDYLQNVRASLANEESVDEIIYDIEGRVSELLGARLTKIHNVNTVEDVDIVINTLGTPDAIVNITEEHHPHKPKEKKRLFRDPFNRILGGVLSGLSYYFGLDVTWVRVGVTVLFLLMMFSDSSFLNTISWVMFVIYIVMWILVPKATTNSEILEMQGKPVTLHSFKDLFLEKNVSAPHQASHSQSSIKNLHQTNPLGHIFRTLGKIFLAFILFFGILAGVGLILFAFVMLFSTSNQANEVSQMLNFVFETPLQLALTKTFFAISMIMTGILLIYVGFNGLTNQKIKINTKKQLTYVLILVGSIICSILMLVWTTMSFSHTESEIKPVDLTIQGDSLYLERTNAQKHELKNGWNSIFSFFQLQTADNQYYVLETDNDLEIRESKTGKPYMELQYSADGYNKANAKRNIQSIEYSIDQKDNHILEDNNLYIPHNGKFRNQNVTTILYLPKGFKLKLKGYNDVSDQHGNNFYIEELKSYDFNYLNGNLECETCTEDEVDNTTSHTKSFTIQAQDIDTDSTIGVNIKMNKHGITIKKDT